MIKRRLFLILVCLWILSFLLYTPNPISAQNSINDLPLKYKKWLTEDVVYIITRQEKDFFLRLKTDEQRNRFIESFWQRRDPIPETIKNEFKEEHYRRIKYANEKLADDTPREGWRTDRGRIYILLGNADDIYKKVSSTILYPLQIWIYHNVKMPGIPSNLRIMFFKRYGVGEFRLYNPIFDGLEALVTPVNRRFINNPNLLPHIDVEVRQAAFTISPGYNPHTSQDIVAELLSPSQIIVPKEKIKLGGVVATEIYYVTMPIDILLSYWRKDESITYLDYVLEVAPKYLTFKEIEDRYVARLDIYGTIVGRDEIVAEISREVNIELSQEQLDECEHYYFNFLDRKQLIPGEYKLRLFIRNYISNEIGRIEKNFAIPQTTMDQLSLSTVVLAYKLETSKSGEASKTIPFTFDQINIYPKVDSTFEVAENFYICYEIYYPELKDISPNPSLNIRYSIVKDGKVVKTYTDNIGQYISKPKNRLPILKLFSPDTLAPGQYTLRVEVEDKSLGKSAGQEVNFFLSDEPQNLGRFRFENAISSKNFIFHYDLGRQYYIQQLYDRAKIEFRIALDFNPNSVAAMVSLAKCLLFEKNYNDAMNFLNQAVSKDPYNYEALVTLAACNAGLNQYQEAIKNYQALIKIGYTSTSIYNALGQAYFKIGDLKRAAEAFQSSLEINPKQPEVQNILTKLKNK